MPTLREIMINSRVIAPHDKLLNILKERTFYGKYQPSCFGGNIGLFVLGI